MIDGIFSDAEPVSADDGTASGRLSPTKNSPHESKRKKKGKPQTAERERKAGTVFFRSLPGK